MYVFRCSNAPHSPPIGAGGAELFELSDNHGLAATQGLYHRTILQPEHRAAHLRSVNLSNEVDRTLLDGIFPKTPLVPSSRSLISWRCAKALVIP
jgi:hypothetical protein